MPKEAFGGDDSGGGGGGDKKRPGLSRFGLSPDTNIRDVFWKLMASYADSGKPGMELSALENDRFPLMRAALSVLSGRQGEPYGLVPRAIAAYSIMMMVDGGWKDALGSFLSEGADETAVRGEIAHALKGLLGSYREAISEACAAMLRERKDTSVGLSYIAGMEDAELSRALRKELIIIARGGIGDDQMNAIKAISLIKEDEDVRKSLIILLSHWDAQTRLAAAEVLKTIAGDSDAKAAAAKRLPVETDARIKAILAKIAEG
ncbi:hypothetical protein H0O00_00885 [Candidatus Micrarchaeota archaeon]|nr:hypothetical protein [Candidatus Micrarchaeota archaeon]